MTADGQGYDEAADVTPDTVPPSSDQPQPGNGGEAGTPNEPGEIANPARQAESATPPAGQEPETAEPRNRAERRQRRFHQGNRPPWDETRHRKH